MRLRRTARFQCLPLETGGRLPGVQLLPREMIVKDHRLNSLIFYKAGNGGEITDQDGFHPKLDAHFGVELVPACAQRGHEAARELRAAHATFPRPKLRQDGGGNPVGGKLRIERKEPLP